MATDVLTDPHTSDTTQNQEVTTTLLRPMKAGRESTATAPSLTSTSDKN